MDVNAKMDPHSPLNKSSNYNLSDHTKRRNKFRLSIAYLICGYLGLIGLLFFSFSWRMPSDDHWKALMVIVAISFLLFYIMTLLFIIWIHPILCSIALYKRRRNSSSNKYLWLIFILSSILTLTFTYLIILKSHFITV